jgi:hypothetical protein
MADVMNAILEEGFSDLYDKVEEVILQEHKAEEGGEDEGEGDEDVNKADLEDVDKALQ